MSGWIKFDKDMADDPRMIAAAMLIAKGYVMAEATPGGGIDLTGPALQLFARNALLGALLTLWKYADEHVRDDDTLPLTSMSIDALVGLRGFCSALPDCWLVELDDGTVKLPGYCSKNSLITKRKRAEDNKARQARWRERRAKSDDGVNGAHNASVTRYASVTKCVDQDQDQDKSKKLRSSSSGDLSPVPSERRDRTAKKADENRKKLEAALSGAQRRLT
jgi:hypothetical protein